MNIVTERDARDRVRELVQEAKASLGMDKIPPYQEPMHPLTQMLGIEVEERCGLSDEGLYLPGDKPQIALDSSIANPERRNFTFFHEVTHHLIRSDGELYGFLDDHSADNLKSALETYCNIGAAEFLIPYTDVKEAIRSKGFSMSLLKDLDEVYPASRPAITIQMTQCASHQCVIVVCEPEGLPDERGTRLPIDLGAEKQTVLRVSYASVSPSFTYRCGRGAAISKHHLIAQAFSQRESMRGVDDLPFRSGRKWSVDCEAFYYKSRVYAAFNVTSPPSNLQPAFSFMAE
jgi:hypothetical protein